MNFEFDPMKSAMNKVKHGIDFEEAQFLWDGKTVWLPLSYPAETRHLVLGMIGKRHWSAIVTKRKNSVRIISVRRSRREERKLYEQS